DRENRCFGLRAVPVPPVDAEPVAASPGLFLARGLLGGVGGQAIDALVLGVPVVALYPLPVDPVRCRRFDQVVPQVRIADGLLAGVDPALLLPPVDPPRHAVDHIAAV